MSKTRFVIVGCGHIGMRHAEMVSRNPHAEVAALVDIDPAVSKSCKKIYTVPFFETIETFLDSGIGADVITISTPNGSHTQLAEKAIEKGFHVVIEKPMGLKSEDCLHVIKQAEARDRKVFCVMQNRYSPPSRWLKKLIEEKALGNIYMVQVNCFWNRDERYYTPGSWRGTAEQDGGPLFTQFSHFVDLIYWLFGDIHDIQARFNDFNHSGLTEAEDSGNITFKFESGAAGQFNYTTACWDSNLESSITIIAENGSVKVGGQYMENLEYCHIKNYKAPKLEMTQPPNDYGHYKGSAANHHYIIENVIETLKGESTATTNAEEGYKVVEMINRIYAQRGIIL